MTSPEHAKGTPDLYDVFTEDLIKSCLKADKGDQAVLKSFEIKDFTKKGDNYICAVTGVHVDYELEGRDHKAKYVAKLNKPTNHDDTRLMVKDFFEQEKNFYTDIGPTLSRELKEVGHEPLRFARAPYVHFKDGVYVMFMEDLRERGFTMYDRRKGLDDAHIFLVLKELARIHASSTILQKRSKKPILESHPYLYDGFMQDELPYPTYSIIMAELVGGAALVAEKTGGYDQAVRHIKEVFQPNSHAIIRDLLRSQPPFQVVTHGDCWTNNTLFRYNESGIPEEVALVDFQMSRGSSPMIDITYLFQTSITGDSRRKNMSRYFREYYSTFQKVILDAGFEMDFTFEEMEKEFDRLKFFGFYMGLMLGTVAIREDGDGLPLDSLDNSNVQDVFKENSKKLATLSDNDALLSRRIFDIFDEMEECGAV
ncbi:putative kinase-like protein D1044.1 [Oratosquilla oratoria]|uniref:putative kinase-like protein D1044.1 n=1 Tax=Oratosquilla oratoria TaxID=337810 RepID=UPI003F770C64